MTGHVLAATDLQGLFDALHLAGYQVVGPTRRNDSIAFDIIEHVSDLPAGFVDDQEAGQYRLRDTGNGRYFDFTVGAGSPRGFLRPPREPLWRSEQNGTDVTFDAPPPPAERYALLGVRSCDLAALGVLDTVLTGQAHTDTRYGARRDEAFIVAVQCARAGGTCFCASMDTGPRANDGFDLALTELPGPDHIFFVEIGSDEGAAVAAQLPLRAATDDEVSEAREVTEHTTSSMRRSLETDGLRETLLANLDHEAWQDVADRCLSCANCTMVCPTCFCTTVEVETDLRQTEAIHTQVWDSCFHADFTYMHGGSVRTSTKSRYRQWLTHKLATWHDQFQQSGCVGCGRCITWCPVGIDLTQTVATIRQLEQQ